MKKTMKKILITAGAVLLFIAVVFIGYFGFMNTYKNPVKGDSVKGYDETVEYKTLSDGMHTIAVGYTPRTDYYRPHEMLPNDFFEKLQKTKGFIKLYDNKCNLVKSITYGLDQYFFGFDQVCVTKNGFVIYATASAKKSRRIKLQYDNNLNLVKTTELTFDASQRYIFDDLNVYVKGIYEKDDSSTEKDKVYFCDQNDKIIKTISYDFYSCISKVSCIDNLVIVQGRKYLNKTNTVGFAAVYNKKGEFLWDYQYKDLQYAAVLDACRLPDNTLVLYGEANDYSDGFEPAYNGLSFEKSNYIVTEVTAIHTNPADNKLSDIYNSVKINKTNFFLVKLDYKGRQIKKYSKSLTNDNSMYGISALKNGDILAFGRVGPDSQPVAKGYITKLNKNLNMLETKDYITGNGTIFFSPDNSGGFYTYSFDHGKEDLECHGCNDYYAFEVPGRANHFKTITGFALSQSTLRVLEDPIYFMSPYKNALIITGCVILLFIAVMIFRKKIWAFLKFIYKKTSKKIIMRSAAGLLILLIIAGLLSGYFRIANTYVKPVKDDNIKLTDQVVDFKTLSNEKYTVTVGNRYPDKNSKKDAVGLIKLYDSNCQFVTQTIYDLDDYDVILKKANVYGDGFIVSGMASVDAEHAKDASLPKIKYFKLYYDNNLQLINVYDIDEKHYQHNLFNNLNVNDDVMFCDLSDSVIKTIKTGSSFSFDNVECVNNMIILLGRKYGADMQSTAYAAAYDEKGKFLWEYQYKDLKYAAFSDADRLTDNEIALYGESSDHAKIMTGLNSLSPKIISNTAADNLIVKVDNKGRQLKTFTQRMTREHVINRITALSDGRILTMGLAAPEKGSDNTGYISILDSNLKVSAAQKFPMHKDSLFIAPDDNGGFYTFVYNHEKDEYRLPGRVNRFNSVNEFVMSRKLVSAIGHPVGFIIAATILICSIAVSIALLKNVRKRKAIPGRIQRTDDK